MGIIRYLGNYFNKILDNADDIVETATRVFVTPSEKTQITTNANSIISLEGAYNRRGKVIDIVDNTLAPPTEVLGDRYILDEVGGGVNAAWDGAIINDIVTFDGLVWIAETPDEGWTVYIDDLNKDGVFIDDGSPFWEFREAAITIHNNLTSLQGGTATERYHINVAELTDVQAIDQVFTLAEKNKVGFLTVTQAVDLDTVESDTNTNTSDITGLVSGTKTFDKLAFNTSAGATLTEGQLGWNADAGTVDVARPDGGNISIGQEMILSDRPRNKEGVQINNGEVVYMSGITAGVPEVKLANASNLNARDTIAVCTNDVANEARGAYTTFGAVRDFNTTFGASGDWVYLDTTNGQLTITPPEFPNWIIRVGKIIVSDASVGVIDVNIKNGRGEDLAGFFSGTFREGFNALVTSNGTIVTMSLERKGTGDLTMQFSTGEYILDCTPAQTIALTPGTIAIPQENFVYIPISTKVLTVSTTQWPAEEHIKISYFFVQTAAYVQSDGCLINQNWNDPLFHDGGGHLAHITENIRRRGAVYFSGLDGAGADDYTTSAGASVTVQIGAGVVYQMHNQTIPAKDTSGTDDIHVLNAHATDGGAYYETQNLYDITVDTAGNTLNNKFFNITLISVGNKGGEYSPILVNIPGGSYNSLSGAQGDIDGHDVFDIPREFVLESSTAVLVCRLTFRKTGGTWAYQSTVNLRGKNPTTASGGGTGGVTTEFSDSQFAVYNNIDPTKIFNVDSSTIATSTTRTMTMPDSDVDLGDIATNNAKVSNVTTNLSNGSKTATTYDVNSSDGTNVTLVEADTTNAGLLGSDKWDEIVANTAKVSGLWQDSGTLVTLISTDANKDLQLDALFKTTRGRVRNVTIVNSATYDLLETDDILHVAYTATGEVTSLTLPTAQTIAGRVIVIKDSGNATTNPITVDTEGSAEIDGGFDFDLDVDYDFVTLYCDGTDWFVI